MSRWQLAIVLVLLDACARTAAGPGADSGSPGRTPSACSPCVTSDDCTHQTCIQMEYDNVCEETCHTSADCDVGDDCLQVTTFAGDIVNACIPRNGSCGALPVQYDNDGGAVLPVPDGGLPPPSAHDAGTVEQPGYCNGFAGPTVPGTCCRCRARSGQCDPNNCFGGYFCDPAACRCVRAPSTCSPSASDRGAANAPDAGHDGADAGAPPPPTGPIDAHSGGTTDRLYFAVIGDTRPPVPDDNAGYPVQTITDIYSSVARLSPAPEFVVTTGDYMFASTNSSNGATQIGYYLHARDQYAGPVWPAMGNHECTGATGSNCGPETSTTTRNYTAFVSGLLGPIGETQPWFTRRVDASDGSWTAKFVFVAPNAWGPKEAAWFEQQLAVSTTYTFVVHHQPAATSGVSSLSAINATVRRHPVTLSIVGHTHTWEHFSNSTEVVIGNGGAPLTSRNVPYGYTLFSQRTPGGPIDVTAFSSPSGRAFAQFAVNPDGTAAQ